MEFQKDGGLSSVILICEFRKVQAAFETQPKVAPPSESKFTNQRGTGNRVTDVRAIGICKSILQSTRHSRKLS